MNRLKKKLKEQTGASITWALLIFLVCTVVGSAVLVAGTAAAGRMSKLAENDQRYYAVTSTAGLLRDILSQPVTVTRTAGTDPATGNPQYTISYSGSSDAVVKELVHALTQWPDTDQTTNDPALFWEKDSFAFNAAHPLPNLSIVFSAASSPAVQNAIANVTSFSFDADGYYIFATVSKDGFSMNLVFELELPYIQPLPSPPPTVDTKLYRFSWKLVEARIVESTPAPLPTPAP